MTKKIAIIGRGTAGAQAAAHFFRWVPDCEIEWHFDPNTPTKAVGEGSNLVMPRTMAQNFGFGHRDLGAIEGTFKTGIYKEGWGAEGKPFFHDFRAPSVAYHFNAVKLQEYIFDLLKDKVKIVEANTNPEDIDADFVVDCSGKPSDLTEYEVADCIPLNAVKVFHCDWDFPTFNWTLTIARPYGWVFGIPLQGRCAVGYMYNKDFNTVEDINEDVQKVLQAYELTCTREVAFEFQSYTRKQNFTDRVAYNGDKSFFLEPLEATSTHTMDKVNRLAFDVMNKNLTAEQAGKQYADFLDEVYNMIMLHYYAGSQFNTPFWDMAVQKANKKMDKAKFNPEFRTILQRGLNLRSYLEAEEGKAEYGTWWEGSFQQNIQGLGLVEKLKTEFSLN